MPSANGLAARIPPPIIALAMAGPMVYVANISASYAVPATTKWLLVGLWVLAGLVIELSAVLAFRRAKTTINPLRPHSTRNLVTSGVYRFTRNPMYLGLCLQLMALVVYLTAPVAVVGVVLFIVLTTWLQIVPEEQALRELFGEEYNDYCQRVRRWV